MLIGSRPATVVVLRGDDRHRYLHDVTTQRFDDVAPGALYKGKPYAFTDGIAQFQQCFGVVHELMGMLLHTNFFDTVLMCVIYQVAPVGDRHSLPLIPQDFMSFGGPGSCDPIWVLIARSAG